MDKFNEFLAKFRPTTHLGLYLATTLVLMSGQWTTQRIMVQDLKLQEVAIEQRQVATEERVAKLEIESGREATQMDYISKQVDEQTRVLFEIERHLNK